MENQHSKTMKYAVQNGIKNIVLKEKEIPRVTAGHVLARMLSVGICGSDLHQYREREEYQVSPDGHEVACQVVAVGSGVENVEIGDCITIDFIIASTCGECEFCLSGNPRQCQGKWIPFGGAFSEYVLVKAESAFRLPQDLSPELGSLVEPLAVGVHAIRCIHFDPSKKMLIIGGGMIGLATLAVAKFFGFENVDIVARHEFQREAAKMLGARNAIEESELVVMIQKETKNGLGYDYSIEAVGGTADSLNQCFKATRPMGQIVVLGAFKPGYRNFEFNDAHLKEVSIISSNCYGTKEGVADYEIAIKVLSKSRDQLQKLNTHKFSLENISEGFKFADGKNESRAIKVQIVNSLR